MFRENDISTDMKKPIDIYISFHYYSRSKDYIYDFAPYRLVYDTPWNIPKNISFLLFPFNYFS